MSSNSSRRGAPKHQNRYAWKPKAGQKINEREVGGKLRPYPEITGVCPRCKDQIDWKRRYGKYKPLSEPAKCQRCTKRAVRQAYHNLCPGGCAIFGDYNIMDKGKSENSAKNPANKNKVGELFPSASLEEYAAKSRGDKDNNNGDNMDKINDEDDGVDGETGVSDLDDDDDDYVEDAEQVCNW
ncbi:hypothetical protein KPL70_019288 [Citrus sinensis]|nr:hypothetical protein KPL70_019288 [Citrus sinensis]